MTKMMSPQGKIRDVPEESIDFYLNHGWIFVPEEKKKPTWVKPEECLTEECRLEVGNKPKLVYRKKGRVYLGYQVPDIDEPGLSSIEEVHQILEEIKEDYEHKAIDRRQLWGRLHQLIMIIRRDTIGDLGTIEGKIKALNIVNQYMKLFGFGQYDLRGRKIR